MNLNQANYLALVTSERQLTAAVLEMAAALRWRSVHFRPGRTASGWRTAVEGDGVGWPDLFMVRGERTLAAELKSAKGHVSPAQDAWLGALEMAGVETHVWRPLDWHSGRIEEVLL